MSKEPAVTGWHVTPLDNVDSIMQRGLLPGKENLISYWAAGGDITLQHVLDNLAGKNEWSDGIAGDRRDPGKAHAVIEFTVPFSWCYPEEYHNIPDEEKKRMIRDSQNGMEEWVYRNIPPEHLKVVAVIDSKGNPL